MPTCRIRNAFLLLALILISAPGIAGAWPANVVVTNAPGPQVQPEIVSDGAGGAIVLWRDYTGVGSSSDVPVYARRVLASGIPDPAWPVQGLMVFAGGSFVGEGVVPDGAGGAFVGWASGDHRYLRVQHVLSNGTFDPEWPAGGRVVRDAGGSATLYSPKLVSDATGGNIVAWQEVSSSPAIRAKHLGASGEIDPTWPAGGRVVAPCACIFSMVTDHAGGAIFASGPFSTGAYGVVAYHLTANGSLDPAWPAGGRTFGQPGNGALVIAVSDRVGGVILLWTLYSQPVAYAQHVLANGNIDPVWPATGVVYGHNSAWFAAVEDGTGGVISSWLYMTDPDINSYFVYGQRILGEGVQDPQWPASSLYVADTDSDSPADPRAVSDGEGGAIVAFEGYGFFAVTHVLSSGAVDPSWPANGWRVGVAPSEIPALVYDGTGGVIVAWRETVDQGANNLDIHAQRINIVGASTSVPERLVGPEPVLARVTPTPTRGASTIDFTMPAAGRVAISIHDIGGRKVCDLLRADVAAGTHSVKWNGRVDGRRAPNGVYFVSMETERGLGMRQVVLIR